MSKFLEYRKIRRTPTVVDLQVACIKSMESTLNKGSREVGVMGCPLSPRVLPPQLIVSLLQLSFYPKAAR